jgi:hypothetical protein
MQGMTKYFALTPAAFCGFMVFFPQLRAHIALIDAADQTLDLRQGIGLHPTGQEV